MYKKYSCLGVCVCRRGIGVEEEVNYYWLIGVKEEGNINCGAVWCYLIIVWASTRDACTRKRKLACTIL